MSEKLTEELSKLLADSYTLYLKTQNYHWNVTGPQFASLHALFETQYTDLQTAVDDIAERIRALGKPAPGSFAAFSKLSSIEEANDNTPDANTMVQNLANDQRTIIKTAQSALKQAKEIDDEVSIGLIADRMTVHEKNAWMLDSST